jgi:uncharacterized integral membrane protein (TIGR00697 family)
MGFSIDFYVKIFLEKISLFFSGEFLTFFIYIFSCTAIIFFYRFYKEWGLFVYTAIAIIGSNIQVLRLSYYSFNDDVFPLGTALFTSTFLVQDILVEHYGIDKAKKNIHISFWAQIIFCIWMIIIVAHPHPTSSQTSNALLYDSSFHSTKAIEQLFIPSIRFFFSSLIAFYISQWSDIIIFSKIRTKFHRCPSWIGQFFSMSLAGLIDSFIFSAFAWIILAHNPISWSQMLLVYCFHTQIQRVFFSLIAIPFFQLISHKNPQK